MAKKNPLNPLPGANGPGFPKKPDSPCGSGGKGNSQLPRFGKSAQNRPVKPKS